MAKKLEKFVNLLTKRKEKKPLKRKKVVTPASKFSPLSKTSLVKLILSLVKDRSQTKKLQCQLERLQNETDTKEFLYHQGWSKTSKTP